MAAIDWVLACRDVPSDDVLDGLDLADAGHVSQAIHTLVWTLEKGDFLVWEAVMREEQSLPLTRAQRQALGGLLSFADEDEDEEEEEEEERILSIDGCGRPTEPWYESVRRVAKHLLVDPFETFAVHYDWVTQGWRQLESAIREHAGPLSLPPGAASPIEVVPAERRHRLALQACFSPLEGIGQQDDMTLGDDRERWRVDDFIEQLRSSADSVDALGLTLERLLRVLVLPPRDRELLVGEVSSRLRLASTEEPIHAALRER